MTNLQIEASEIDGARKLLCKLQREYAFSIVPNVMYTHKTDTNYDGTPKTCNFPISTKYRKLAGDAMVRWLLESKDNMRKYLYGDPTLFARYITDKKDKVIRIEIYSE